MDFFKKHKAHILVIALAVLLIGSAVCNVFQLRKNQELTEHCLGYSETIERMKIDEANRCHDAVYRLARDKSEQFAEIAEKYKDVTEEGRLYGALVEGLNELVYLFGSYEMQFHKEDDYFLSESLVRGWGGGPYGSDFYYRIYYFYDTSEVEKNMYDCDYYKSVGNNVYFAVSTGGDWDIDYEGRTDRLDKFDNMMLSPNS